MKCRLKRVYLLLDPHHGIKTSDIVMLRHLQNNGIPHQVVLSKIDRVLFPPGSFSVSSSLSSSGSSFSSSSSSSSSSSKETGKGRDKGQGGGGNINPRLGTKGVEQGEGTKMRLKRKIRVPSPEKLEANQEALMTVFGSVVRTILDLEDEEMDSGGREENEKEGEGDGEGEGGNGRRGQIKKRDRRIGTGMGMGREGVTLGEILGVSAERNNPLYEPHLRRGGGGYPGYANGDREEQQERGAQDREGDWKEHIKKTTLGISSLRASILAAIGHS